MFVNWTKSRKEVASLSVAGSDWLTALYSLFLSCSKKIQTLRSNSSPKQTLALSVQQLDAVGPLYACSKRHRLKPRRVILRPAINASTDHEVRTGILRPLDTP